MYYCHLVMLVVDSRIVSVWYVLCANDNITSLHVKIYATNPEKKILCFSYALLLMQIGMGRNEMGEGTAVLQAVNSLRNEENMFIREDEIHMQGTIFCSGWLALTF